MSSLVEPDLQVVSTDHRDISRLVIQAVQYAEPLPPTVERRKNLRKPYPNVISVTPLTDDTMESAGETISAVGRHISSQGLDFFHDYMIPEKRVIVGLQSARESWAHFVLELGWSRFVQGGWYISGGRFTQVITWTNSPNPPQPTQQRDSF